MMNKNNKAIIVSICLALALGLALISLRTFFQINGLAGEIKLVNAEIKALSAQSDEMDYMSEGDAPYIIRELISSMPDRAGVEVQKVTPQKIKPAGEVKSFPVEVEMLASIPNIEKYIFGLNIFKTPVYVDRLILKRVDDKTFAAKAYISLLLVSGKPTVSIKQEQQPKVIEARPLKKNIRGRKKEEVKPVVEKLPGLQGIMGTDSKKAIINDNVVGVGESVNGYKVKNISSGQVILEKSGKTYKLDL